ncbi:hypothetical protein EFS28_03415 [Lactobacillus acidophilus]|uniref:ATP-dependent nuclease n=1 Tax=Lactobacillus acidophilus TaxID=1579 RepID=UPI0021A4A85D|nr:ATP-binding protein [Lactobacillus acidophilus]MCT3602839.1 hypothetical protein [Lactobacillus acidophilus]MCT3623299.1 hypothetical protein [Lactobacillus acidophilus]
MWIKNLKIQNFRAFQKETNINFSKRITAISGLNGVGKSTLLAILTNVGELKKYKTISGSIFRGDFGDVIMYDDQFDTSGLKCTASFEDLPSNCYEYDVTPQIDFSAHIQKGTKKIITYSKIKNTSNYQKHTKEETYSRYRLIPSKRSDRKTEKKVKWPSYYLGLSRLSPLGEYDTAKTKNISSKIAEKIIKIHAKILSENLDDNAKLANLIVDSKHPKADISSKYYGFQSNSSGQDNTGQIIEAVLSFEILKEKLGKKYIGGILAIDELDATLHPAAQNRLVDWLLEESKELDLQIVFTTHSLTLLEHLTQKQSRKEDKNNILINYLSVSSQNVGAIRIKENPSKSYYRYNLQETYARLPKYNKRIKIYTEDETARWFLTRLIDLDINNFKFPKFNMVNINMSWKQLVQLYQSDTDLFSDSIFILDPDVNMENKNSPLSEYIENHALPFIPNSIKSNVLILPGNYAIEKEMWIYVNGLKDNDLLFEDPYFQDRGVINPDFIKKMNKIVNPRTEDTIEVKKDSKILTFKNWFKDNGTYRDKFLSYWIKDNIDKVEKFLGLLHSLCVKINNHSNQ